MSESPSTASSGKQPAKLLTAALRHRSYRVRFQRFLPAALLFLASCAPGNLIPLSGEWEFKKGLDSAMSPEEPYAEKVRIPGSITEQMNLKGYAGWVTIRREFPPAAVPIMQAGGLALNMGWASDVTVYYINGQKVGSLGSAEPYESALYRLFVREIPHIEPRTVNVLHIAMYTDGTKPLQFDGKPFIGRGADVFSDYYRSEVISYFLLGIYFVVGGYHLLLYTRRSTDLHNLVFAVFCFMVTLYWLNRSGTRDAIFGSYVMARLRLEYITLFLIPPVLIYFLSLFFYRRFSKVGTALLVFNGLLAAAVLFLPYWQAKVCLTIWQASTPFSAAYVIFYIVREALKGNVDARWMSVGLTFLLVAAIHDIVVAMNNLGSQHIARYAFLIFILSIAAVLANSFMRLHKEVEQLNEKLEDKVRIRTQQLAESLEEVQKLKIQQDGDYFLTSLLIHPLTGNFVRSANVSVDMLLRQKKQFRFRHWQAEIGGDLCIAQNIRLQDRTYSVFLNGDAMGKSIQGAGGALVLGTVFKSMVSRTQMTAEAQDKDPEQWLKECFLELQNVFVSFDGSMMVSAVFGLVDEETGILYYINAEHPFVVLYRAGRADFLETDISLRKLGVAAMQGVLQVKTCQLLPNDVVIVGSDGRDDVQIGVDQNGNRIINENELEFLRHVEKGGGDLRKIEQSVLGFGQLTDDFTLLRIGFKETGHVMPSSDPAVIGAYKAEVRKARSLYAEGQTDEAIFLLDQAMDLTEENAAAVRLLTRILIEKKEFDRAANLCESYTRRFPADTEFLYVTSYAYARSGETRKAIEFAERCRLRDPSMVRNLMHLARIYRAGKDDAAARKVLEEVLDVDPNHEKARQLL